MSPEKRWGANKAHKFLTHKLFLPPFATGLSQGQTRFVPGTNWASSVYNKEKTSVCPLSQGQPGFVPGTNRGPSQAQPDQKVYVYVLFSSWKEPKMSEIARQVQFLGIIYFWGIFGDFCAGLVWDFGGYGKGTLGSQSKGSSLRRTLLKLGQERRNAKTKEVIARK